MSQIEKTKTSKPGEIITKAYKLIGDYDLEVGYKTETWTKFPDRYWYLTKVKYLICCDCRALDELGDVLVYESETGLYTDELEAIAAYLPDHLEIEI